MLTREDLEAISQLMDAKMAAQKKEIIRKVGVLIENEVTPKFNLLAEGQEDILRRMPSEDDMDIIDGRLTDLEQTVRRHETEIAALKRAN